LQQKISQAQIPNARANLQSLTGYIQQTTTTITTTKLTASCYRNAACKKIKFWVSTALANETETKIPNELSHLLRFPLLLLLSFSDCRKQGCS